MTAEIVRRAILRALLVGIACACAFALAFLIAQEGNQQTLGAGVTGALLGVLLGVVSLVELPVDRDPDSRARIAMTVEVLGLALAVSALALFQVPYTVVAITSGPAAAAVSVSELGRNVADRPGPFVAMVLMASAPLAVSCFLRFRWRGWIGRVAEAALSFATDLAIFGLFVAFNPASSRETQELGLCALAYAIALATLIPAADALERRLLKAFSREA